MVGNYFLRARGNYAPTEELRLYLERAGYGVFSVPGPGGRLQRLWDMTWPTLKHRRQYQVAIIEVYSGLAFRWAEWVCFLLRLTGKPYILNLHGIHCQHYQAGKVASNIC